MEAINTLTFKTYLAAVHQQMMDKEDVVRKYNGISPNHKKK